ncbi:MAG: hypothetical protein QHH06_10205 [Clostridiales bacterium]|jgi:hypothetical protein|nr:hypothetical protein [Eubacteriales bacterium]MDH7566837.1 hypothetical protein [Clostridiales bacterium]
MELDDFISRIPDFDLLSASEKIPYFAFYLTHDNDNTVSAKEIKECFNKLALLPYSNIASYLNKKSTGKDAVFLKNKNGYRLSRTAKAAISLKINEPILKPPTNNLLPLSIFENAPFYIGKMASQMCSCYDAGLYDACLVMMRKLTETLIIECFERYGVDSQIKDANGNFFYLSELIPLFIHSSCWNVSRNLESNIKKVKKYGDLSAHNRRFFAKKPDIDDFKFELRQALEEIIHIIDYSTWLKRP